MAKLLKIAKTKDVPPGQAAPFTIEGQKIALFNVEGTYYAVGDTCTHRGGPLSEGDVLLFREVARTHASSRLHRMGARVDGSFSGLLRSRNQARWIVRRLSSDDAASKNESGCRPNAGGSGAGRGNRSQNFRSASADTSRR